MASAHVLGPAILSNKQVIKGKALLFDTQFHLSPGECINGAQFYFNETNRDLEFEKKPYIVYAAVSIFIFYPI
jgi:hypothetical protein